MSEPVHDPRPTRPAGSAPPADAEVVAQAQVVAGALAAAVVVYAAVVWLVVEVLGGEGLAGGLPAPLPGVLVTVAALVLILAPAVERRIFAASSSRRGPDGVPGTPAERYRSAKIAGFALREAAAVLGLVVGLTTGDPRWTWAIAAGTLLLMALAWPRAGDLPPGDHPSGPVAPR